MESHELKAKRTSFLNSNLHLIGGKYGRTAHGLKARIPSLLLLTSLVLMCKVAVAREDVDVSII